MTDVTHRFVAELRQANATGGAIEGHAAVFKTAADLGFVIERLAPTAFDAVLERGDEVVALKNHDPNLVVGRTGKNLDLTTDKEGLRFRIDPLPDTAAAHDLREEIAAGLITGASFGFIPGEEGEGLTRERLKDGRTLITHTSIAQLLDVSPVTFPAYTSTEVSLRSMVIPSLSDRERLLRIRYGYAFSR